VYAVTGQDDELHLVCWPQSLPLGRPAPGDRAVIDQLAKSPCTPEALAGIWQAASASAGGSVDGLKILLDRLRAEGWLISTVTRDGRPLYTVYPLAEPPPATGSPAPGAVLSRFAVLRRDGPDLVLESPRAHGEIRVHEPSLLAVLGAPGGGATTEGGTADAGATDRFRQELHRWGFLAPDADAEQADLRHAQWGPHELWFHARSRMGRHYGSPVTGPPVKGWARGRFDPLPGRRPPYPGPPIALARPDLDRLRRTDATLTAVLEGRRSLRAYDDARPITLEQLGEFLYRCAAVRTEGRQEDLGIEVSRRPYPAGGAIYEVEVYLAVRHAAGLEPGLYHYDAYGHELRQVPGPSGPVRRMLTQSARTAGMSDPPQVLVVLAARFGRLLWKYQAMAYALALKHVGVMFEVMYAVSTAMGLAPCALGNGDSDAFALATGVDPLEESSVGEFALGSSRPEDAGSEEG
jgi:SagB-type dehydrogenase family enzyme